MHVQMENGENCNNPFYDLVILEYSIGIYILR